MLVSMVVTLVGLTVGGLVGLTVIRQEVDRRDRELWGDDPLDNR